MPAAGNSVFAPAIFFIAFREALEASLVIGILTGLLESLVKESTPAANSNTTTIVSSGSSDEGSVEPRSNDATIQEEESRERRILISKLRNLIFLGAGLGLLVSFFIGAAFLAVFYTQTKDLYGKSEELWEGIFTLIAVLLITPMSLAILRADRSRNKWRLKLKNAFEGKVNLEEPGENGGALKVVSEAGKSHPKSNPDDISIMPQLSSNANDGQDHVTSPTSEKGDVISTSGSDNVNSKPSQTPSKKTIFRKIRHAILSPSTLFASKGTFTIFIIPFVTTLREGLEGVVYIGGVSLGLPAKSIPLPAIVGIFVGLLIGVFLWRGGSFGQIRFFLILSTCFLLIIAAGMASRCIYYLQFYGYVQKVGDGAAESGSGPGSYDHSQYIAHFDYGNPENNSGGTGWGILNSICGWNNTWTYGSTLAYVFYWLFIIGYLGYAFWSEGRLPMTKKSREMKEKREKRKRERDDKKAEEGVLNQK